MFLIFFLSSINVMNVFCNFYFIMRSHMFSTHLSLLSLSLTQFSIRIFRNIYEIYSFILLMFCIRIITVVCARRNVCLCNLHEHKMEYEKYLYSILSEMTPTAILYKVSLTVAFIHKSCNDLNGKISNASAENVERWEVLFMQRMCRDRLQNCSIT